MLHLSCEAHSRATPAHRTSSGRITLVEMSRGRIRLWSVAALREPAGTPSGDAGSGPGQNELARPTWNVVAGPLLSVAAPQFPKTETGRSGTTRIRPPPPSGRPAAAGPIGLEAVHEDLEVVAELLRDRPLHDVHRLVAGLGRVVGDAHVVFGDKAPEERVAEEHHQPRDRARVEGGGAPGRLLTAVENGGAGRSKMVALGGVDLP
jgi:hypothetical protein